MSLSKFRRLIGIRFIDDGVGVRDKREYLRVLISYGILENEVGEMVEKMKVREDGVESSMSEDSDE